MSTTFIIGWAIWLLAFVMAGLEAPASQAGDVQLPWSGPCRPTCQPGHRRRDPQRGSGSYCPAAGFYRNQEMVDLGADVVLAFQRNGSRGTQDCIDRARRAGLLVMLVEEALLHDTALHAWGGGFGVPIAGCPACEEQA